MKLWSIIFSVFFVQTMVLAQPEVLWERTYGGGGYDTGLSVIEIAEDVFVVAGRLGNDGWVLIIDQNGEVINSQTFGGNGQDLFTTVKATDDRSFVLGGFTESFGAGAYDYWLVKIDDWLDVLWSRTFGDGGNDRCYGMNITNAGGYVLTGSNQNYANGFLVVTDENGEEIWSEVYNRDNTGGFGYDVYQNEEDEYITAGVCRVEGEEFSEILFLKTDNQGEEMWSLLYGGEFHDQAYPLIPLIDGGYLLGGDSRNERGDRDFIAVKTDANGEQQWLRTNGGNGDEQCLTALQTNDGGLILGGWTNSFGAGSNDVWLVKYNLDGDVIWTETYGDENGQAIFDIIQTTDGGYIAVGANVNLENNNRDVLIIRFAQDEAGMIFGNVIDSASDEPIEGAIIQTSFGQTTRTNEEGFWQIESALVGEFEITASCPGYNDSTLVELVLEDQEELEINFGLLHPELIVSVGEIEAELDQGQSVERQFSVRNEGNGPMQWWVDSRLIGESGIDPWEARGIIPAGQILENNNLQGIAFVDDFFYVSGGGIEPNLIYVLDREGESVGSFEQFGFSRLGMRDLTHDGELLWSVENRDVFGFTRQGELITEFAGPVNPARAIAYDPDREILWICGTTTNIFGVDREGNVVDEIDRNGLRIYGMSYWQDDPDDFGLYVLNRPEAERQLVTKVNPDNGEMMFVAELEADDAGSPGGTFLTNGYDPFGSWVYMNIAFSNEGDLISIRQLKANDDWMILDAVEGELDPAGEQELILTLDAENLEAVVYEGELIFNHFAAFEEMRIPVTLSVQGDNQPRDLRVNLSEGWNMISINVVPPDELWEGEQGPDIRLMTEQLRIDENNHHIILMKNGSGQFYAPAWDNFNNIPFWDLTKGYLVKVDQDVEAVWSGIQIPTDADIQLTEGWNMISYFPIYELDASAPDFHVLSPILDRVILAKDNSGRFLSTAFRFSNMSPWHETQGYQVKVDADVVLNYPEEREENVIARSEASKEPQRLLHFVRNDVTGDNMSMLVTKISGAHIQFGDEIGAFNSDGKLIGVGYVDSQGRCGIAIWGDDKTTEEVYGLREGDTFSLSFWDSDREIESDLSVESLESSQDLRYSKDSFIVMNVSIDGTIPNEFYMSPAYPNPFNSTTTIEYALPFASEVTLNLYNLSGQRIETLVNGRMQAGVHRTMLDAGDMASGLYFVKLEGVEQSFTQKIMLVK
jgi:hypothetical protein